MTDFFEALQESLQPDIDRILSHRFVKRIADASLSERQLQFFVGQYHWYCEHFPRFLAAAAANIPDDETRFPLLENLWEEHGSGDLSGSHRTLYYHFAEAAGLNRTALDAIEPLSTTRICCENMLQLCRYGHFLEALGALGPGTEYFTNREYSIIAEGLKNYNCFDTNALDFWTVHISLDEHHYSDMIGAIRPWANNEAHRSLIRAGAKRALDLEFLFWEGLEDFLPGAEGPSSPR